MKKLIASLKWIDNNLLKILVIGSIFIIPLYPKKPFMPIEYTYISIRLEDFYVVLMSLVFFIQLLRKKIELNKRFFILFMLFWMAIGASLLMGYFVHKTIPHFNIGLLHSGRRVEYMILFFIAAVSIRTKKDFYQIISMLPIVITLACLYGIGQKFLGFPAWQTMNPAFARGMTLYLTPEARVSSTFAGHYDFAAYLVLTMPIILGLYFWKRKLAYFLIFILSLFLLVLTASRISYIAYIISIFSLLIFLKKPKQFLIVLVFTIAMTAFSSNLTSRFLKTFQVKQIFINDQTGNAIVPQKISSKDLPAGSFYVEIKKNGTDAATQQNADYLKNKILSDVREEASRSGKTLTSSEEAQMVATLSANLKPINTVVSDISFATRLQIEWPRAVNSFMKDPLFGTGPSSITESTDNDFLRWIGEFGAIGTGIFLFIIFSIAKFIFSKMKTLEKIERPLYWGFLFGIAALLINAAYIDVFEASKVAYTFWTICGLFIGSFLIEEQKTVKI
ncbi:hypothetical protein HGB07_02615 [Candidatus Roizmanbacteria bacterium]|nr:hypothetical protein [Candidatus Roizmanbacteria bacterium]